jgi:large subunit ribosomal protein L11
MSNKALPVPPLGTILGNLGVNTISFCDQFNNYTSNLPNYFLLQVKIEIFENKTFSFTVNISPTGFLLNLLKYEKKIKIQYFDRIHEKTILCVNSEDVLKLALFKFPKMELNKSINIILGTLRSMNIVINID